MQQTQYNLESASVEQPPPYLHDRDEPAPVADVVLVARMTRGDRAALSELYVRHAQALLAFAYGVLREQHDAEDVIHDVFLEAWRGRHSHEYSESRASVRTWLLMRTRYRTLDRLRSSARARRHKLAESHASVPPAPFAGQPATSVGDGHRLPAALAQIPETLRHVIVLAYFEGLSTLEISSRLGIPAGTVKSRTHAAIKTLRSVLGVAHE
ncbi:MAG: hypothetical protein RL701_4262 [Pseudomonadota bacterium]